MAALDHLVLGTRDLAATAADVARMLGVVPSEGGPHVGLGTRNVLLDLDGGAYLEIIGPDPDQPEPGLPRPFGVDGIDSPRLVAWAARVDDLDTAVGAARERGHDPGVVFPMQRSRPDGVVLTWRLTLATGPEPVVVPFLIEWGDTPHPSATAAHGCRLVALVAEHPGPLAAWPALDLGVPLEQGERSRLAAVVEGPAGRASLTSEGIEPA